MRRTLAGLVVAAIWSWPAWGWGNTGHMVIGRIAAKNLKSNARAKVAEILGVRNTVTAVGDAMAEAAIWPDVVARSEYPESGEWHFLDLSLLNGASDKPDPFQKKDTAFAKITAYAAQLPKPGHEDELEDGSDLKFIVHLVGDIHQPLHGATNQDRGGNCLFVKRQFDGEEGPGKKEKLHGVWDTGILESFLGNDPRGIANSLLRDFRRMTPAEQADLGAPATGGIPAWVRAWVLQSHGLARTAVYQPLQPPVPQLAFKEVGSKCKEAPDLFKKTTWILDQDYLDNAGATIEKRLLAGGLRLAALLNRMWP